MPGRRRTTSKALGLAKISLARLGETLQNVQRHHDRCINIRFDVVLIWPNSASLIEREFDSFFLLSIFSIFLLGHSMLRLMLNIPS